MSVAEYSDPLKQFFALFASANEAIWPLQFVWYAAAVVAVFLAIRPIGKSSSLIAAFLGAYYVWIGVVYHWLFYSQINDHAWAYGAMFVLGGILWLVAGVVRSDLVFRPRWDVRSVVGGVFIVYALVLYPILGMLGGHVFPAAPVFGIAPCPTVIYTFGLLLWTQGRTPAYPIVVPLVWSLTAITGALAMGVYEDLGMAVAGVVGTALLIWRDQPSLRRKALAGLMLAVMIAATGHDDILMGLGLIFLIVTLVRAIIHRWSDSAVAEQKSGPKGNVRGRPLRPL